MYRKNVHLFIVIILLLLTTGCGQTNELVTTESIATTPTYLVIDNKGSEILQVNHNTSVNLKTITKNLRGQELTNAAIKWEVIGGIGKIDGTGTFTATWPGTGIINASLGNLSDQISIEVYSVIDDVFFYLENYFLYPERVLQDIDSLNSFGNTLEEALLTKYGSIEGFLLSLNDPYTRYLNKERYNELKIRMRGNYSGIGIYMGIKNNYPTVISAIKNTPAWEAGLESGDKIVSIDGQPSLNMSLEEAVSLIRGSAGTPVVLEILRGGDETPIEYTLIRSSITISSLEKYILANEIGYIKLSTFEQLKTVHEFEGALLELNEEGVSSLILDLRNNGGGLLQNAVEIASMFIEEGPIVYAVDRNNSKTSTNASGDVIWDKPVVVLVNEGSASASEILAAALRDYDIADLVGVNTFGKNLIQNIRQLEDGSALLFTIAKYQTPGQEDIPETGITPDYIVSIPTAEADSIELDSENDPQLLKALEILGVNNYPIYN